MSIDTFAQSKGAEYNNEYKIKGGKMK